MHQTSNDNQNKEGRYPYNGQPLQEGEVLVPQFITREYADLIEAKGVRTWYKCGIPYLVMFVPVPADQTEIALKAFNADLNTYLDEQLGPNRHSRCLIRQPDGSTKICPKEINGQYNTCRDCPLRGQLEKENLNPVSLDALNEEDFHPMDAVPSAEDYAMLRFLLEDLLNNFSDKCPRYAEIIQLGFSGLGKKEILEYMPMKKSQTYKAYNDCRKATEDFLKY